MKITIEFENWDEMETFRTSGKKSRGRKGDVEDAPTVDEVRDAVAANTPQQPPAAQPVQQQFAPPPGSFPGVSDHGGFSHFPPDRARIPAMSPHPLRPPPFSSD